MIVQNGMVVRCCYDDRIDAVGTVCDSRWGDPNGFGLLLEDLPVHNWRRDTSRYPEEQAVELME